MTHLLTKAIASMEVYSYMSVQYGVYRPDIVYCVILMSGLNGVEWGHSEAMPIGMVASENTSSENPEF